MDEIARFLAKYKDPRWAECSNDDLHRQLLEEKIKAFNEKQGDLEGYDCSLCRNKGMIYSIKDGEEVVALCVCLNIRADVRRTKREICEKQKGAFDD